MFQFNLNRGEVKVYFDHDQVMGVTACRMAQDDDPVAVGMAFCHIMDNYNKAMGRKIAFTRALDNLGIEKKEREIAWCEFFSRHKLPTKYGNMFIDGVSTG
ncbi:MAG: hypothetical protein AABY07_01140 [Nanoarchaeota archaeon]